MGDTNYDNVVGSHNPFSTGAIGTQTPITANAGGGQASGVQLVAGKTVHEVTTVTTAADSVKLPPATGSGAWHFVKNSGANSVQVFGTSPDTIDGVATGTGVAIAAGKARLFIDTAAGKWQSLLGA